MHFKSACEFSIIFEQLVQTAILQNHISMSPKITDTVAWQQAELLMQPTFIRIIDNIRNQLDESAWKGTYEMYWLASWDDG